ncbi:hypothetical protein CXB77_15435 [Chromatium okenii]|jgi:hypothetical protein|uniref:Uncharacterized protein n=1 Tax=Chromatium okenii TaxID=61644 RepID=A0A2S7XQ75_9GAMM|nr:hypothetical protein CXB77_15435 [Chromatium okenii]
MMAIDYKESRSSPPLSIIALSQCGAKSTGGMSGLTWCTTYRQLLHLSHRCFVFAAITDWHVICC